MSLTLVPVCPVMNSSPDALKKLYASLRANAVAALTPARSPSATVLGDANAPAASVGPSIPSVPATSAAIRFRCPRPICDNSIPIASAHCCARPPFPIPRTAFKSQVVVANNQVGSPLKDRIVGIHSLADLARRCFFQISTHRLGRAPPHTAPLHHRDRIAETAPIARSQPRSYRRQIIARH